MSDTVDLPSDETYQIFLQLEVLELRREVDRLKSQNNEYREYITNTICQEQTSKRTMSQESRDKLKFYHVMKDSIVAEQQLPDTTPWYVVKKKTDALWKTTNASAVPGAVAATD